MADRSIFGPPSFTPSLYPNQIGITALPATSAPPTWNWTDDEEFRKKLGEAWANNDLAAGYAEADKGSPAPTGRVGEQRRRQPWEMPGSLFAISPMSYNPLIQRRG